MIYQNPFGKRKIRQPEKEKVYYMTKIQAHLFVKYGLTPREREIAEAVYNKQTNQEIADKFIVTQKCIKFHLTNTFKKMRVQDRKALCKEIDHFIKFNKVRAASA